MEMLGGVEEFSVYVFSVVEHVGQIPRRAILTLSGHVECSYQLITCSSCTNFIIRNKHVVWSALCCSAALKITFKDYLHFSFLVTWSYQLICCMMVRKLLTGLCNDFWLLLLHQSSNQLQTSSVNWDNHQLISNGVSTDISWLDFTGIS